MPVPGAARRQGSAHHVAAAREDRQVDPGLKTRTSSQRRPQPSTAVSRQVQDLRRRLSR